MNNLGKANVYVEVLDGLVGISKVSKKYNFDITSYQWPAMQKSSFFLPFMLEQISDSTDSFSAIFPAKRKYYIDNYIAYKSGNSSPDTPYIDISSAPSDPLYIIWTPTSTKEGIINSLFDPMVTKQNPIPFNNYELIPPQKNISYPSDYIGPQWEDSSKASIAPNNDIVENTEFLSSLGIMGATDVWPVTTEIEKKSNSLNWVNQRVVRDGLWWGIESNAFLKENMPFWVNLGITSPPSTPNHVTQYVVSLGVDDESQAFDIVFSLNNKPYIIDYYNGRKTKVSTETTTTTTIPIATTTTTTIPSRALENLEIAEDISRNFSASQPTDKENSSSKSATGANLTVQTTSVNITPLAGTGFTPLAGTGFTPLAGTGFTPLAGTGFTPLAGTGFTPLATGKNVRKPLNKIANYQNTGTTSQNTGTTSQNTGTTVTYDNPIYIIQPPKGAAETKGKEFDRIDFDVDLSKILDTQKNIEVGVMAVAGRLVIWINQVCMVYSRVNKESGDNNGTFKECKIASGRIRIYGTNTQCSINVCPMTFAPFGAIASTVPSIINNEAAIYKGVKYNNTLGGSIAILPQSPDKIGNLYGVDCKKFLYKGDDGNIEPKGVGFHSKGQINFIDAIEAGITNLPKNTHFYIIIFKSEDTSIITPSSSTTEYKIPYGGCPFFFRLKGGIDIDVENPAIQSNSISEVISASESTSAPDYFHALANATVTIYNKDGKYDYLRNGQYGIRIYWGWNKSLYKTFTGVITSVTTSEVPGNETMTLQCEDYMYVLKNTPIVNSPFYDGMVAYYALMDLAKRAGVTGFSNDFVRTDDYFLPSGYTFSKPVMRFPSKNMIFQCMMDITKRFEAFMYFDSEGILHLKRLPGGLFSETNEKFVAEFGIDPYNPDASKVILNEKNVEINYNSTVNEINIYTLNRENKNAILYVKDAKPNGEDHILFRKILLLDQPALGGLEEARTWAARLAQRVFYPIRKTSFSTVGFITNSNVPSVFKILDFVKVDGLEYRLMSISKKYSAGENDFTNEYTCEWLGGK